MEESSKLKSNKPAAFKSAVPRNDLIPPNSNLKFSPADMSARITHQLPGRPIPIAPRAMTASALSHVQVGTDVLDFRLFPEHPVLITDHLRRVGGLLRGVEGSEDAGSPPWPQFILNEALKVVNATCPLVLRKQVLRPIQGTSATCRSLASRIPARYFPASGTVVDRFFTGLIGFLEDQYSFPGRHAMDIPYQQGPLPTTFPQTSNAGRKQVEDHRSNSHSKRRKPHSAPKILPNMSVPTSDRTKQEVTTSEYSPEAHSEDKRDRNMETASGTIQTSCSRKRKSLDQETLTKDGKEDRASTGDPTPIIKGKKKRKKKKATRTCIEPTVPSAPSPVPEPKVIKLEDSSNEASDEESDAESDINPPSRPKRNVYEYMYHKAQEDIRFFERFLQQGAGISKADIDASKIRVAMGQSHKKAFDQVFKPSEKKLARRPRTPEQD
ncbi:hypothetical protein AYL99_08596 [Fonsecaea erecta]|uniref:Uncharacterized protein n=1 Tax=Fonsecaea erecta TaxID=1367422 RepID=A0A178ZDM0_9EURO|nr:hypothetical protein AYL99_08596 [Fonsecaea erecta]OAP57858.1 hypothetical protein AYL99_08596 [Fonsecaea erecta]